MIPESSRQEALRHISSGEKQDGRMAEAPYPERRGKLKRFPQKGLYHSGELGATDLFPNISNSVLPRGGGLGQMVSPSHNCRIPCGTPWVGLWGLGRTTLGAHLEWSQTCCGDSGEERPLQHNAMGYSGTPRGGGKNVEVGWGG